MHSEEKISNISVSEPHEYTPFVRQSLVQLELKKPVSKCETKLSKTLAQVFD